MTKRWVYDEKTGSEFWAVPENTYDALAARLAEAERTLREIAETTKGYPNASREGELARAYLRAACADPLKS